MQTCRGGGHNHHPHSTLVPGAPTPVLPTTCLATARIGRWRSHHFWMSVKRESTSPVWRNQGTEGMKWGYEVNRLERKSLSAYEGLYPFPWFSKLNPHNSVCFLCFCFKRQSCWIYSQISARFLLLVPVSSVKHVKASFWWLQPQKISALLPAVRTSWFLLVEDGKPPHLCWVNHRG